MPAPRLGLTNTVGAQNAAAVLTQILEEQRVNALRAEAEKYKREQDTIKTGHDDRRISVDEQMLGVHRGRLGIDQSQIDVEREKLAAAAAKPTVSVVKGLSGAGGKGKATRGINERTGEVLWEQPEAPDASGSTNLEDFLARYASSIGKTPDQLTVDEQLDAEQKLAKARFVPFPMYPAVTMGPQGPGTLDKRTGVFTPATMAGTGEPVGRPLGAGEVEKVAGGESGVGLVNSLIALKRENPWINDNLGPAAGRMSGFKAAMPGVTVPPAMARFRADTATLRNAVIKAITGAQMSEPEAQRIREQIPEITDKPEVWDEKARSTIQNLENMNAIIFKLRGQTPAGGGAPGGGPPAPPAPAAPNWRWENGKLVRVGGGG